VSRRAARVRAQAKVNLFLRVLAREDTGYHQIETLFCRLELADDVVVRVGGGGRRVDVVGADTGPAQWNLAYRAANTYAEATGWPDQFAIEIVKRIPVGGGLGGGSSDAAAVLRALNRLNPEPVEPYELLTLAAQLGADVPFLTTSVPLAFAWGRGERLLRLPGLPSRPVVLVVPDFGVSTRDAYAWLAEWRGVHAEAQPAPDFFTIDEFQFWYVIPAIYGNAFEAPVFARYPELADTLRVLERVAGVLCARMSGSGSTIFGVYAAPPAVDELAGRVAGRVVETRTAASVPPVELLDD
jgi:4-diphosphocytidyl-2-C-methyl-D-erythritol kinase